jgi:hypothetical protein
MARPLEQPPGATISWDRRGLYITSDKDLLPPGWPGWGGTELAIDGDSVDALCRERMANLLKPNASDVAVAVYRSRKAGASADAVGYVSGLNPARVCEMTRLGELIEALPVTLQAWLRKSRLTFGNLRSIRRSSTNSDEFTLGVLRALDAEKCRLVLRRRVSGTQVGHPPSLAATTPIAQELPRMTADADDWSAPVATVRSELSAMVGSLDEAVAWLRDPTHPVQRLVEAYQHHVDLSAPEARSTAHLDIVRWLTDPDLHAHIRSDPVLAVETVLDDWSRQAAGSYW